jgi:signal transduction histidine kinase
MCWGIRRTLERLATEPFASGPRDAFALVVAGAAIVAGSLAFVYGSAQSGIEFTQDEEGRVVIGSIAPWSTADDYGLRPGMVVVMIDDQTLVDLPGDAQVPSERGDVTLVPSQASWVQAAYPLDLEAYLADPSLGLTTYDYYAETWRLDESGLSVIVGLAILLVGGWWLSSGRAGGSFRSIAIPTVVATSVPLLLVPAYLTTSPAGYVLVAALVPLAILPLADGLTAFIPDTHPRRMTRLAAFGAATYAVLAGLGVLWTGPWGAATLLFLVAASAITLIPGSVASTRPVGGRPGNDRPPSTGVVESVAHLAVGATPFVSVFTLLYWPGSTVPILLWIAALLAAQRFTVRPLTRIATRATLQRDLVMAATEAERARIAADLHDETLQDLTLLVRQLDARGATDEAASARRIAERVRTMTGELRLPILDDLGVGPALEWLVGRMERLAGGEVRLERDDGSRLPAEIELAFFRVAQEALANAVKHGRPPIVVRFRSSETGATLTIDDAGAGIPAGAAEAAPAAGHFGLLGMQQRAEQIGALLDVRRWPTGGTHVALEWRAR